MREHRLIFEHYLKIVFDEYVYIPRNIEIDHNNNDKQDNSLINLNCFTRKEHKFKHRKDMSDRFCLLSGDKTGIDKEGYERWHKYKDGFICNKCYMRYMK